MKVFIVLILILIETQIFASRARDKALQTDKFPRPPETVSGTVSATTSATTKAKH